MRAGLSSRWSKFLVTGAVGAVVQMAVLALLRDGAGWGLMPAAAAAVEAAILHNFFWNLRWTWATPRQALTWGDTLRMLWRFNATSGAVSIATSLVFTRLFMDLFGLHYLLANFLSIGTGTLANFAAGEFLVFRTALILPACLLLAAGPGYAVIDGKTEDFLRRSAGFRDRDLAEARSGRRVVKTLDPGVPQEMVTVGVTRFEVPFDYFLHRARTGDLYRVGPTLLEIGRFSSPPALADLAGLTLDDGDLEPFGESDPAAVKKLLVEIVRSHQFSGFRGLAGYLANYPLGAAGGATQYFAWAKVHIGLKRLVRLTKVTVWELDGRPRREAVMVTEQVFASRYFQASLQVDHVIAETYGGAPAIRLVSVNWGRCDILGTALARLVRPLILSRTRAATRQALDLAKTVLESEYRTR